MSKSTCLKPMIKFATTMVKVFGPEYLRELNPADTSRFIAIGEARGSPCII